MTKKLIIIDDSSTQLSILKSLFANDGWEVCGVQNAKIAYEMIFDFAPDLIITDAVMPLMGGFKFVQLVRENEKISKIPLIVYSILNEVNAKFYIKEEYSEFFLKKDNNQDELLALANNLIKKFPLDEEYKLEILRQSTFTLKQEQVEVFEEIENEFQEEGILEVEQIEEKKFDCAEFNLKIKEKMDFSYGDTKIFSEIFSILNSALEYDLLVLCTDFVENKEKVKKVYFDIRNIILSPILRNSFLENFETNLNIMNKKYAPNLPTVVNEAEFLSKIEFNFDYKEKSIAQIKIYSTQNQKWDNFEEIAFVENVLADFFKARDIKRSSEISNNESASKKYLSKHLDFKTIKNQQNAYFLIIQISNYLDYSLNLSSEDLDVFNSRVSEKIINCLDKEEQVYKSDSEEYSAIIYAKDEKQARSRMNYILKEIDGMNYDEYKAEILIGASNCLIDEVFNIKEAQKRAFLALDVANSQEKMVIYND